ncbi:MAG: SH3 domain-containing protein [Clostridia bacterium]|nr:SH3 domain-containing protein [Clostridia bacterium]
MKKVMAALLIVVLLAAVTVPAYAYTSYYPTSTSPWAGYVTASPYLNIRSSPSTSASIISSLLYGKYVEIVGVNSTTTWYTVQYNTLGSTGYASANYLSPIYENYGQATAVSGLNIRQTNSTNAAIVGQIPYQASAAYLGSASGGAWSLVVYGSTLGYVSSEYFSH